MPEPLSDSNFILFAARSYDNPGCFDTNEFYDDLGRFKYIKKLLSSYKKTGVIKQRLILNHIIILSNVFGKLNAFKMLYIKMPEYKEQIKTFFLFMEFCPVILDNMYLENINIEVEEIEIDNFVLSKLKEDS